MWPETAPWVVLALAFLGLGVLEAWLLNRSPTDHRAHVFMIRETMRHRWRLPAAPRAIVNPASWGAYPIVLHFLIGKLPRRLDRPIALMQAPLFTLATTLVVVLALAGGSTAGALLAFALALFSPTNFDASNARNYGLGSRAAGQLFFALLVLSTLHLGAAPTPAAWLLAGLAAVGLVAINTFALQGAIFWALASLAFGEWRPLLLLVAGAAAFALLFGEYGRGYLRDTFRYWRAYQAQLAGVFVLTNYPSYWVTPFVELPRALRARQWKRAGLLVWKNTFANSLLLNPLPWLAVLGGAVAVEAARPLWGLFAGGFLAFFLTSLRPMRFWGEPHRYLEFLTPFAAWVVARHLGALPAWIPVGFAAMIAAQLALAVALSRRMSSSEKDLRRVEELLVERPEPPVLLSNDNYATRYFMKHDWKFVTLWSIDRPFCGLPASEVFARYPYLRFDAVCRAIDEFAPSALLMRDLEEEQDERLREDGYARAERVGPFALWLRNGHAPATNCAAARGRPAEPEADPC